MVRTYCATIAEVKVTAHGGGGVKDKEGGEAKKKKGFNSKAPHRAGSVKLEGNCEGLKGAIYDCSDTKLADIFIMTLKKDLSNYVGQTMKCGGDMRSGAVITLQKPVIALPKLAVDADTGDRELVKDAVKLVGKRQNYLKENFKTLYAIRGDSTPTSFSRKLRLLRTSNQFGARVRVLLFSRLSRASRMIFNARSTRGSLF